LLHRVVNGSRTQHRNPTDHGLEPCLPPHISAAHFVMVTVTITRHTHFYCPIA